ncbi:hypothetical protein D9M71_749550 [compost metagenome]
MLPGKSQHALGQGHAAQCTLGGVVEQPDDFRVVRQAFAHDFQIAKNDCEQIIEVVGNPPTELADGLHLLRLEQRFAGLFKCLLRLGRFGDVAGDLGKA